MSLSNERSFADAQDERDAVTRKAAAAHLSDVIERGDGGIRATVDGRPLHIGSPAFTARGGVTISPAFAERIRVCEADGATAVVIAIDHAAVAIAALGDALRPDSRESVAQLRHLGFVPEILSGDASPVVATAARAVGIDPAHAHGQLTPEQKLDRVRHRTGRPIIMVGDGVNDAAALAAADVGVAVHGGAEASLAAADVYIARPGLRPLAELARMSRRTMGVVRRNLAVSLAYNVLAASLAVGGLMTPMIAAILMPVSSVTVLALTVLSIGGAGIGAPSQGEGGSP